MTKTFADYSPPTPSLRSTSHADTAALDPSSASGPATVALRRAVLAGGAATLALVAGTASAVGSSTSPDAELIALCGVLDGMQRQIDGLFPADWRSIADAELDAADAAAHGIERKQRLLLDRFCALLPSTLSGCAAVARSLALLRPDLVLAGPNADMDVRLMALLLRGMTGEGA